MMRMAVMAGTAAAALATTLANAPSRIFGADNISRHIARYGGSAGYKRSRGKPTKPKRKRNMLHVSKRVRRKHRRNAARG